MKEIFFKIRRLPRNISPCVLMFTFSDRKGKINCCKMNGCKHFANLIFSKFLRQCGINLLQMIELCPISKGFVKNLSFIIIFCILVARHEHIK
jgi:hypothetical protein